ncbi:MAG: OmpA family protein [Brumimicrobium sp.]|nr:OmpA family protein [Brumimicrobium sp.]
MLKFCFFILIVLFSLAGNSQPADSLVNVENFARQRYLDSLFSMGRASEFSPIYFKERYNEIDLMYKITDNYGEGFDSLYGTRNLRPILHGVAYRGGANNYFHKTNKRNNHNPLPDDGIRNLCAEGFSASVYLYRENFETAPPKDTCACVKGGWNDLSYYQFDYFDEKHIYEALKLVYESAINDSVGPVYLHCWNGWHASGLLAALTLRQFCGYDKWEAINYWDLGTDGANNSPRYQKIREMIKDFEPYEEFRISDSLGNAICPPMPQIIDSSELYVDIEHLVYVPESIPVGFSIVLHNVRFGSGQNTFSNPSSNPDLQNLLKALEEQPELKVEIGGYTDNVGSVSKNTQLSASRAKFVYDFLIKNGISEERITFKGYGPQRPLYSNRYSSTREGNRRIEIKILEKAKEDYSKLIEEVNFSTDDSGEKQDSNKILDDLINGKQTPSQGTEYIIASIDYEPNMVKVPNAAMNELNQLASFLEQNRNLHIEIQGHSDRSGLEDLNELLSEQRAEAVYNYLIEQGVSDNQLSFKGYGSEKPIMSNKYQYGKDANRRISVVVIKK